MDPNRLPSCTNASSEPSPKPSQNGTTGEKESKEVTSGSSASSSFQQPLEERVLRLETQIIAQRKKQERVEKKLENTELELEKMRSELFYAQNADMVNSLFEVWTGIQMYIVKTKKKSPFPFPDSRELSKQEWGRQLLRWMFYWSEKGQEDIEEAWEQTQKTLELLYYCSSSFPSVVPENKKKGALEERKASGSLMKLARDLVEHLNGPQSGFLEDDGSETSEKKI
mmetsp:Transcript_40502/g.105072  ORF Transcript_40502/g.105072 Transcript_40502/m.105072 type:complete len:226 (+) Transcript_40502:7385-8062(+)